MITEKLRSAGMKAYELLDDLDGEDVFSLLADEEGIGYWPGQAEIKVYPDPKHRQAVMHVTEPQREITHEVDVVTGSTGYPRGKTGFVLSTDELRARARRRFPVATPPGTQWSIKRVYHEEQKDKSTVCHTYLVTAKIPASEMTFLVGIDETAHFVSQLPAQVKSVKEAHRVLKPDIVRASKDVKRQGEWFFIPVVDGDLIEKLEMKKYAARWEYLDGGDHLTISWDYKGNTYAFGLVSDTRRERHADLHLEGWHQVVRNCEIFSDFDRYD